jgi:hypothetical protein
LIVIFHLRVVFYGLELIHINNNHKDKGQQVNGCKELSENGYETRRIMKPPPKDQCIVLPLRQKIRPEFDGVGLALHFLLGNVLVLHTGLKEMWFGWRVKKIFKEPETFRRYCRETETDLDLSQAAHLQKIRLWLHGDITDRSAELQLFDEQAPGKRQSAPVHLKFSIEDDLIEFRTLFLDWLASIRWPMPKDQVQAALWPERISHEGLDAVGRSLEELYLYSYDAKGPLDMAPFKMAVDRAPRSFMALDLYGWAFYRNRNYKAAHDAFLASLAINPAGAGAMSGLMWCGVYTKDLEEAMFWSGRKADVCGRDVEAARAAGRRRYEKVN